MRRSLHWTRGLKIHSFHSSSCLLNGEMISDSLPSTRAHFRGQGGIGEDSTNSVGHRLYVSHRDQNSSLSILDDFRNASSIRGDYGFAGCHSFEDYLS